MAVIGRLFAEGVNQYAGTATLGIEEYEVKSAYVTGLLSFSF